MNKPHFITHHQNDDCAVAVLENIKQGDWCEVWIMDNDETRKIKVSHDIPIGHKVVLKNLEKGSDIIKYGVVIGRLIDNVKEGDHLHVHNLKTKRW